jgi:hypothetical protein
MLQSVDSKGLFVIDIKCSILIHDNSLDMTPFIEGNIRQGAFISLDAELPKVGKSIAGE